MNVVVRSIRYVLSLFLALSAFNPKSSSAEECLPLAEMICEMDGFDEFCSLLDVSGILDDISNSGSTWTVFAPYNDAMELTYEAMHNYTGGDMDLDDEQILDLLTYHLVEGEVISNSDLTCTEQITMSNGINSRTKCRGDDMYQVGKGNEYINMNPMIIYPETDDLTSCDGSVIHIIDVMMVPKHFLPKPTASASEPGSDDEDEHSSHDHASHDHDVAEDDGVATPINYVVATAETYIYCSSESGNCDDPADYSTSCDVKNPETYDTVEGYLTSGLGQFGKSYGDDGFFVDDGTGGIFVLVGDTTDFGSTEKLEVGTHVKVSGGTTVCLYGTLALSGGNIAVVGDIEKKITPMTVAEFSPSAIGQFEKPPSIPNFDGELTNVCNCLNPLSYTQGRLITVRGTMVGDLFDDSPWGWKVFLDDGNGIGQVFIDGASDYYVESIKDTLLVSGTELCVTGLVAQFAGVGWELLPRDEYDVKLCD